MEHYPKCISSVASLRGAHCPGTAFDPKRKDPSEGPLVGFWGFLPESLDK